MDPVRAKALAVKAAQETAASVDSIDRRMAAQEQQVAELHGKVDHLIELVDALAPKRAKGA